MSNQVPALQFKQISKDYGRVVAASDVTFDVAAGEFLTLLGQSGSGKTTLLKIVAGFESPTRGELLINGRNVLSLAPKDRGLGMVFQSYALFPHMSVAANIAYGLRRHRWKPERARSRVNEMLELVQMGEYRDRKPAQLSGGQQQRVSLARALAFEPPVLLMDEPLGALDRALRVDLEAEIRRIHKVTGTTVLYVTHDRDEALGLSDRIAVMHQGTVVGLDQPENLYDEPTTAYVARLLTDANLVPLPKEVHPTAGGVAVKFGAATLKLPSPNAQSEQMVIAIPRSAVLAAEPADPAALKATVRDRAYLGDRTKVVFDVEGVGEIVAGFHRDSPGSADYREGSSCSITFDTRLCRIVPAT